MFYLIINFKLDKNDDKIKAKRILLNIEKMEGYNCNTTCKHNYIEIKFQKDKSATGARICCINYARLLTINSEDDTEVLIMKKGNIGEYDISYRAELAPSQASSNCIEVRKSIFDPNNLQKYREIYRLDAKGNFALTPDGKRVVLQYFGPSFCLRCHRKNAMIINGMYFRQNYCVEDNDPDPDCSYVTCFYCKTVEGSNDANWYWQNPEGEWIHVNRMDCYPTEGLNKGNLKENKNNENIVKYCGIIDLYGASILEKACTYCVRVNGQSFLKSKEWEEIKNKYPKLFPRFLETIVENLEK